ncbi:hypothetical protein [Brevibacillus porteri]|uniref:hypothetical protein n=1 Tax=Brevibacillus porteri TaxID=2126350 RepID=UPI00363FA284
MFKGQTSVTLLKTPDGALRLLSDSVTGDYSIGLRTKEGMEWKYISKELHDHLVEYLATQEGMRLGQ